jgi:hypothetical protein
MLAERVMFLEDVTILAAVVVVRVEPVQSRRVTYSMLVAVSV